MAWSALALVAIGAWGHGNEHAPPVATVSKEQQPWGIAAEPRPDLRTIHVTMNDRMRFAPARISVREGESVRLVVRNRGRLMHELVMGTREAIETHAALMKKFPNMEHDEPYMVHVPPGRTGEIVWTFNRAGEVHFACLVGGHYEAGMAGRIQVAPRSSTALKPGRSNEGETSVR